MDPNDFTEREKHLLSYFRTADPSAERRALMYDITLGLVSIACVVMFLVTGEKGYGFAGYVLVIGRLFYLVSEGGRWTQEVRGIFDKYDRKLRSLEGAAGRNKGMEGRSGRLPMEVDLAKVADFFKVEPTTDANFPRQIVFRLPRPSGHLLLGIDTAASEVRIELFGSSGESLLGACFDCYRIHVNDGAARNRKLRPAVHLELADARVDVAVFCIPQPPDYEVEFLYVDLNIPKAEDEPRTRGL